MLSDEDSVVTHSLQLAVSAAAEENVDLFLRKNKEFSERRHLQTLPDWVKNLAICSGLLMYPFFVFNLVIYSFSLMSSEDGSTILVVWVIDFKKKQKKCVFWHQKKAFRCGLNVVDFLIERLSLWL